MVQTDEPVSILAKASESPWGRCPCGWMVWIKLDGQVEESHTCQGCGVLRPVVFDNDKERF